MTILIYTSHNLWLHPLSHDRWVYAPSNTPSSSLTPPTTSPPGCGKHRTAQVFTAPYPSPPPDSWQFLMLYLTCVQNLGFTSYLTCPLSTCISITTFWFMCLKYLNIQFHKSPLWLWPDSSVVPSLISLIYCPFPPPGALVTVHGFQLPPVEAAERSSTSHSR